MSGESLGRSVGFDSSALGGDGARLASARLGAARYWAMLSVRGTGAACELAGVLVGATAGAARAAAEVCGVAGVLGALACEDASPSSCSDSTSSVP